MLESKIPLLREILMDAEAHPEGIDLQCWARLIPSTCTTTVCIAGSAVLKTGHGVDWNNQGREGYCGYTAQGDLIERVAQEELGLSDCEASELFYCGTLDRAWEVVERISGGQITREVSYATARA